MPYEPPITDQINHDHEVALTRGRYSLARGQDRLVRQKGARRPPAKTEKTLSPPSGPKPGSRKTKCRGSRILRGLPHGGIPADRPPKPSVEPLFTCQRTFDTDQKSSRKRPDRFEAGQALIVNSRKAVHEHRCSCSPFRARGRADKSLARSPWSRF